MNAEFFEKMLAAKRLEAQALASILPEGARQAAAAVVRVGSEVMLDALESSESRYGGEARSGNGSTAGRSGEGSGRSARPRGSAASPHRSSRAGSSGLKPIVIE